MTVQDLKMMYEYHYWANRKILKIIGQLSPGEFTQNVAGGFGSIRNTMVHVLSTEWGWLSRCGGHARDKKLEANDYPDIESLLEDWNKVESYMFDFLSELEDADLITDVKYSGGEGKKRSMPLGELLHHSIIHGVHHRGQAAVLLRELGHTPGSFDILYFYADKHGVPAW